MIRLLATTALLGALAAAPAFAQTMNTAPVNPPRLSQADQTFVDGAATGGKAEIELGRMAERKGGIEAVKVFGRQMVQDHSKADDQLASVAKKDGFALPTKLDPKDQATSDKLAKESGATFDRDYAKAAVDTHKDAAALFERESSGGQNPDVKKFASDTLPMIQHHLQMAQAMAANMNRGTPQARANGTSASGSSMPPTGRAGDHSANQLNEQELQQLNRK
jgi:putative membrane protein